MSDNTYEIYQLKKGDNNWDLEFMPLRHLRKKAIPVARKNYDMVYHAPLDEDETLDGLYLKFNTQHPADFTGHSLSVSDIVVLCQDGIRKAFYVDSMGFEEVPEFIG